MHTFLLFPVVGVKRNHFICNDPYFPPLPGISGWWVLAWPPGSSQSSYALTGPTTQWPKAAWEFLACSIYFINHQNFGYETCCYRNNFTCGVRFAVIINFSSQSLPPLFPSENFSSLQSAMEIRAEASWFSLCASLWSHNDMLWFAPVTCCCASARQQECVKNHVLVDIILFKTLDFLLIL